MATAGYSNIQAAQTTYEALFQKFFSGGFAGQWSMYTREIDVLGTQLNIPITTSFPQIARMLGTMEWSDIRGLSKTVTPETHAAGIRMKRSQVIGDVSGVVAQTLADFLASQARTDSSGIEKEIADLLMANTWLSYDGVTLLNDSHAFSSGTGDNLDSAALSFETYRATKARMRRFQDERGIVLGVNPTHLMVGPGNERPALEITGATRPVAFSATAQDATSGIVAATAIENVFAGDTSVIVNPYLGDNAWFLMDLSKPGLRPLLMGWLEKPKPIVVDEDVYFMAVNNDEYGYMIKGIYTPDAGIWQLIAGRPV